MDTKSALEFLNKSVEQVDIQGQLAIAKQEGFNEGYKTCLLEIIKLLTNEQTTEKPKETK